MPRRNSIVIPFLCLLLLEYLSLYYILSNLYSELAQCIVFVRGELQGHFHREGLVIHECLHDVNNSNCIVNLEGDLLMFERHPVGYRFPILGIHSYELALSDHDFI
jgi:hypothetical protein